MSKAKGKGGAKRVPEATTPSPTTEATGAPTPEAVPEAPPPPLPVAPPFDGDTVSVVVEPDPIPAPVVAEGDGKRFFVLYGKSITTRRGIVDGSSFEHNHEITPGDLGADPADAAAVAKAIENLRTMVEKGYLEYATTSSADAAIEAQGLQAGRTARRRSAKSTAARAVRAQKTSGVTVGDAGGGDPRLVG